MKQLTFLLLFLLMGTCAFAQGNDRYEATMKENIAQLDTAQNPVILTTLANNFERIASVKSDNWLPYYYAALCRIRLAFMQQDKDKIDAIADKAEKLADQAKDLDPDKAEMLCLRSMIASARIQVNPMARGAQYGPLSAQYLAQAKQLAPDNPRVYLLQGQNTFYTPAQWGGGKDKAKPILQEALKKFATFKPENALAPHWGKSLAEYLLSQTTE